MKHMYWMRVMALVVVAGVCGALAPVTAQAADSAIKIGYVNLAKVFDDYERTKQSEASLESRGKSKQAQLESQLNELKKMRQSLELLTDAARESKTREIEEKADQFKRLKTQSERELLRERNTLAKGILDEINAVVTEFAKSNGFDLIVDQRSVLYGEGSFDVTDEILSSLNARYAAKAKKPAAAAKP